MALVIEVKVVPSSGKSECIVDKSGGLKCFVKSAPEQGKANAELIKVLAKLTGVDVSAVDIIMGATHRKKTVRIQTMLTRDDLIKRIQKEVQSSLFDLQK